MNMMYPRLFLAKNLLREDGVIFISIGEEENHHLRVMCDEIFGKENFVTDFVWEKKKKPSFLHKNVGKINDFILCYVKNVDVSYPFSIESTTEGKRYPLNNAGNSESVLIFPPKSVKFNMEDGVIKPQDMSEGNILTELLDEITICNSQNENQFRLRGEWRYSQKKLDEIISLEDEILISKIPFRPNHVKSGGEIKKMKNTFSPNHYKMETNEDATQQIIDLLNGSFFDTPKPLKLISTLINSVTYENSSGIILDFFAGSATTAHAVMDLNKEDGGNRKFICVQLPEPCDQKSEAYKAGYQTIAEISKERIRRAATKIQAEQNEAKGKADLFDEGTANNLLDLGFRVFKLQKSNFKVWDASTQKDAEAIQQALELHVDHIDPQAEQEAILFELLLKSGFELTTPIENLTLAGKTVFSIAEGALLICLDKTLTSEVIKAMAELNPSRVICLDEGFQDNDQLKTNAVLIMKSKGVNDFRTV
jgi:adenine-specific DNA-methyltransferase